MKLTCEQFENLMIFYLDNELKLPLRNSFEMHLISCSHCKAKYESFKKIICEIRESYKNISKNKISVHSGADTNSNISAYIDNELDQNENIKIRKMIINRPYIRKKVEKICTIRQILKNTFNNIKPKEDFSKNILDLINKKKIVQNKERIYALISFIILCLIWIVMLVYTTKL